MAQEFSALLTALPEDQGSVSAPTWQPAILFKVSPRGSSAHFWSPRTQGTWYTDIHADKDI